MAAVVAGVAAACGALLAADMSWGVFVVGAALGVLMCAHRPSWVAAGVLVLGSADLVFTVDAGGFTFRVAHAWAVTLAAVAVARMGWRPYLAAVMTLPGLRWFVALLGLGVVHVLWGVHNPGKATGYLLWGAFDVLVLAPAVAFHVAQHPWRVMRLWWLGAAAVALFGLAQFVMPVTGAVPVLVQQWVGTRPRLNAFSYEPSYFAFAAMMPAALICGLGAAGGLGRRGPLAVAVGMVVFVAMTFSSSRSAWAGSAVLLLGWLTVWLRRGGARKPVSLPARRVLAVGAATLVLSVALVPPHAFAGDRILAERALDLHDPSSAQPRREGILEAFNLFGAHKVWGVGPGQFGAALLANPWAQVRVLKPGEKDPHSLVTYNLYAELLCETGLLGTALVALGLLAAAGGLWRARSTRRWGRMAVAVMWPCMMTFAVMYQFNQTLWRAEVWGLMGVAWAVVLPRRRLS